MTSLQARVDLARQWFASTQSRAGDTWGWGWGWVSDVPPNPQNTAEVVCALSEAGLAVPRPVEVERLLRSPVVDSSRGEWVFREPIDLSWRIRALRCLGTPPEDPGLVASVDALVGQQVPDGGWRMAGGAGPVSVTATASAVLALVAAGDGRVPGEVRRAVRVLVDQLTDGGGEAGQAYAAAHAGYLLSRPAVDQLADRRIVRARAAACDRLMAYLSLRRYEVEEESFAREEVIDTWRHLTLPLALRALASARPEALFEPAFRDGFIALLALQNVAPTHVNLGGFRTSPEGFVTSYATTQAMEVLTAVRQDLEERVNPGIAFDLICQQRSAHHSDPQKVVTVGRRAIIMNSTAAFTVMAFGGLAGGALAVAGSLLAGAAYASLSRAFFVVGSLLAGLGVSSYLATRLHRTPSQKVVLIAFTLFTALILPVLTFILY